MPVIYDDLSTSYDSLLVTYDGLVLGGSRYHHEVHCAFGTLPPNDPAYNDYNQWVLPGIVDPGQHWTVVSQAIAGSPANNVRSYTSLRVSQNASTGEAEPGTATIVLDNANGWLDPTNPTSPYHGWLVPGVPIRVLITDGNGNYWPDFHGFVKDWPLSQNSKGVQDAQIDCYDALGWLGSAPALYPTELHKVTLGQGPVAYWPHDDIGSTTDIRDLVSGWDAQMHGTADLSGPALTVEGIGASANFVNQPAAYVSADPALMPAPPWTVSLLVRIYNIAQVGGYYPTYWWTGQAGGGAPSGQAGIFINPAFGGICNASFVGGGFFPGRLVSWQTGGAALAPGLYMLTLTYDAAGNVSAFLNGNYVATASGSFQVPYAPTLIQWGAALGMPSPGDTGQGCQIAQVAIFNRVLTNSEISDDANAALVGRAGEATVNRAWYLLDRVGWPVSKRIWTPTGNATCGPLALSASMADPSGRITSRTTLDLLKEVGELEDAVVGCDADGDVMWVGRYQSPPPSFAVGGDLAPKEAAVYSRNDLTVVTSVRIGQPAYIYSSGQTLYNGFQVTMLQDPGSNDEAWLIAERAVALGSQPRNTIDSVTLDPIDTPAALTMDLADTGTVTRKPIWWTADNIGIPEPMQVTSVAGSGGGGQPIKRTFSMLQPRLVRWRARCPSGGTTGFVTPYQARFDSTDVAVSAQFRVDNWAGSGTVQTLAAHVGTGGAAGWIFAYATTGAQPCLAFYWTDVAAVSHQAMSLPVLRTGSRYMWASVVFVAATGQVTFYVSSTNIHELLEWGQVTVGATSLRATGNGPIEVGCWNGSSAPLAGDVYAASVTADSTAIATFDPTGDAQPATAGSTTPPPSWTSQATGETWAPQGSGLLIPS